MKFPGKCFEEIKITDEHELLYTVRDEIIALI